MNSEEAKLGIIALIMFNVYAVWVLKGDTENPGTAKNLARVEEENYER